MKVFFLLLTTLLSILMSMAQDTSRIKITNEYLSVVSARASKLQSELDKSSRKALLQLEKTENVIKKKLTKVDSVQLIKAIFNSENTFNSLEEIMDRPQTTIKTYIGYLDTLESSIRFLGENTNLFNKAEKIEGDLLSTDMRLKELNTALVNAQKVKDYIASRKQELTTQLASLPVSRQLRRIYRDAYYFSARIDESKQVLKEPKQLERKAITLLSQSEPFKKFMQKHSELASFFPLAGGSEGEPSPVTLMGLQTKAAVNSVIEEKLGDNINSHSLFQQKVQNAQSQMINLKDKATISGSFGNTTDEIQIPNFKPNGQNSKPFSKRLEYGVNLQTQKTTYFFPATANFGFSVGYRLTDESSVGVGISYRMGLGTGWQHISLSHEGFGLRSFIEQKIKGSVYLSGGYERNYLQRFNSIEELKGKSPWQSSGLVGIAKKFSLASKMKGNLQILWDFLSYQEVPRPQPFVFRIGYNL